MEIETTNIDTNVDVDVAADEVASEQDSNDLSSAIDLEFEEQEGLDYQLEEMAWMTEDESADMSGSYTRGFQ